MANFTFSFNKPVKKNEQGNNSKTKLPKQVKVELTYHEKINAEPEYYSYLNADGEKCKYSGIVSKDLDGTYIGKVITTHKVILQYHPTVQSVEHVDEYFSYVDNNGNERIFVGTPEFDLEKNTYFGNVAEDVLCDETISIFKDK